MKAVSTLPILITEKDAAAGLKISISTIRRVRALGKISYRKVSGSIKYTEADLIEYLDNGRVPCKRNSTLDKSESTGSHSATAETPGAAPGSTSVHDRQSAHRSAQAILKPPS